MNIKDAVTARKYATAFLNLFIKKIDEKTFLNLNAASDFLFKNPNVSNFFYLPGLSAQVKNESISILLDKFALPGEFKLLADILIKRNMSGLLKPVLREIGLLYQERMNKEIFEIKSAGPLGDSDLEIIKEFINKNTARQISTDYNYVIDKSLIAGIRIQSKTFLWEYSARQKLKNIEQLLRL